MVPLVDYSSDSSESDVVDSSGPRLKKQKTDGDNNGRTTTTANATATKSELPPLPSAFHDLYASTVRVSASDDPTLHQGRKRVNPHKAGHWPSHLYIEWHPTPSERSTLTALLTTLQSTLSPPSSSSTPSSTITTFLTSDLGTPQPLHISLSRPIVLTTAQKSPFTASLESSIRASGISPFALAPAGLEWHRTPESARSFLVLRVRSASVPHDEEAIQRRPLREKGAREVGEEATTQTNPQLTTLLTRFNTIVTAYNQPALYTSPSPSTSSSINPSAFHISIAWSFAPPDPDLIRLTSEAFNSTATTTHRNKDEEEEEEDGEEEEKSKSKKSFEDAVNAMQIRVDGVKAKVGNVVTNIPLPDARRGSWGARASGLFGL